MKIIDDSRKILKWHNRNYFYIATLLLIGFIVFSFYEMDHIYDTYLSQNRDWNVIFMSFRHSNIWHLIGNMISLLVVSIFLERHFGSLKFFLLFMFAVVVGNTAVFWASGHNYWVGESGTNYFLFAIFFTTLLFGYKKHLFPVKKSIFTYVIATLIILLMCWNGNTSSMDSFLDFFVFGFFSDLTRNDGHWSAFIAGACVGVIYGSVRYIISIILAKYQKKPE